MARALAAAGRQADSVRLVAVTKTHPPSVVAEAVAAGLLDLGENYIDEAAPKMAAAAPETGVRWHMIGHIQSRKARRVAVAGFALIHSVDSLRLADKLSAAALAGDHRLPVLLGCNVSGEVSKAGFPAATPADVDARVHELEQVAALPGLEVRGLMTIAPVVAHPDEARPYFARLRALREVLTERVPVADWSELSMGMTDDFEAAIAEGATLIRIGRAIFGARN
jgi:pyridoxal phosphate enzyme (YggS family)